MVKRAVLPAVESLADNILAVYRWANPSAVREGTAWYHAAHTYARGLSERYGVTLEQAAGVLAALSPQLRWDGGAHNNMTCADQLIRTGDTSGVLGGSKRKALAILAGSAPLDILGGPKVRAFYANILDPESSQEVTVDSHATDVAMGKRAASRQFELARAGRYEHIAAAYRMAAAMVGVSGLTMQAICWVAWRQRYAYARSA
jgi:hypothetical protein